MEYQRTPKMEDSKMGYPVISKQNITRNTKSMCPKMENSKMEYLVIPKQNIIHGHRLLCFLLFFCCRDDDWSDDESDSDFDNHKSMQFLFQASHQCTLILTNMSTTPSRLKYTKRYTTGFKFE